MSSQLPQPLQDLADAFAALPSIGRKNALRLAMHVFASGDVNSQALQDALSSVHSDLQFCDRCFHVASEPHCSVCSDTRRDGSVMCVVEQPLDVFSIEQSGQYHGVYFVLGGILSPADGIGPRDIRLPQLRDRVATEDIEELILATNPSMEGEATANYIARTMQGLGTRVTRLARGLPTGGSLEYADERTLGSAFEGRIELS